MHEIITFYQLLLRSYIVCQKLQHFTMCLDTTIDKNETLDTLLGDDSNADVYLGGYEKKS